MIVLSERNILITGIFLQVSCPMIRVSRENPDIDGNSTSANIRSTLRGLALRISHAFMPSGTAATVSTRKTKIFFS